MPMIKKAVKRGLNTAVSAKTRIEKEMKSLVTARIITKDEAKTLMNDILNELRTERQRFMDFAKSELKREYKKAKTRAKPLVKKAVKRAKAHAKKARKRMMR